jgi:hypothetical protein
MMRKVPEVLHQKVMPKGVHADASEFWNIFLDASSVDMR